jgi:hypothetical protein
VVSGACKRSKRIHPVRAVVTWRLAGPRQRCNRPDDLRTLMSVHRHTCSRATHGLRKVAQLVRWHFPC